MLQDRRRFHRRLRRLKGRHDQVVRERGLRKLHDHIEQSKARVARRRQALVKQEFKSDLPILDSRSQLSQAILDNQVVIVCGETGSGKTTQLPRICLDIGRGLFGMIGHTQPRRLAARSVAHRLSEECGSETPVGFQVRFNRTLPEETMVKIMTDGILLAELADDPRLEKYDTIIIDEAHERSLNIDLLMGCLKGILEKRPELRVIVTSATIDSERFSTFFDGAPVFEVSGRQYPVEIIHAESGDSPDDPDKTVARVVECMHEVAERHPDDGDVLVFLPGEREIRELSRKLGGSFGREFDIVPLYARLSLSAQQKALRSGDRRRIVLSTNVAETSLTVPGIRVVIDSGLVRINRFSARRGINRLPIEGVSIASANQRAGRAGRVAPGTCYRLFSEGALQKRDAFTAPEVMRTNLSSLILRLAELGFNDIDSFPLLDRPRPAAVRAGLETLHDLGALDGAGALTSLGRSMAKLPVDPRIARILLSGQTYGCLEDILVIASALSISDPRLRPPEQEEQAAQRHAAFKVADSDFLSLRSLWRSWRKVDKRGAGRRRWCQDNFLSWVRMLEWREIHDQLRRMLREVGLKGGSGQGGDEAIHRALLSGLVANVGNHSRSEQDGGPESRKNKGVYDGPGRRRFRIHPSSDLSNQRPDWIVAAEIVETTRLWARRVAKVDPAWVVEAASHLLEPVYGDPSWDSRRGSAVTSESRMFRGLMVPGTRKVSYAIVDPHVARQMFIEDGLVRKGFQRTFPFLDHNRHLQDKVEANEARLRRRDLLVSELERCAFYESRIPSTVVDLDSFTVWFDSAGVDEIEALKMKDSDLVRENVRAKKDAFPSSIHIQGCDCPIRYGFEPGSSEDGMCVRIPLAILSGIDHDQLQWLVPGLLDEKIERIIRGLDKSIRRNCQPISDSVEWCRNEMRSSGKPFNVALAESISIRSGQDVTARMVASVALPPHLVAMIEVVDGERVICLDRDIEAIRASHGVRAVESFLESARRHPRHETGLDRWPSGRLLEEVSFSVAGTAVPAWTALVDEGESLGVRLLRTPAEASHQTRRGLCRLAILRGGGSIEFQVDHIPDLDKLVLLSSGFMSGMELRDGLSMLSMERMLMGDEGISGLLHEEAFVARIDSSAANVTEAVLRTGQLIAAVLETRQQIAVMLESGAPPGCESIWESESGHMDRLFSPGVLQSTPSGWFSQYPRWLEVSRVRLQNARRDPKRHLDVSRAVDRWEGPLMEIWPRLDSLAPGAIRQMGWFIEEWRAGVFAQGLGQAIPVNEESLREQWQEVRRSSGG